VLLQFISGFDTGGLVLVYQNLYVSCCGRNITEKKSLLHPHTSAPIDQIYSGKRLFKFVTYYRKES